MRARDWPSGQGEVSRAATHLLRTDRDRVRLVLARAEEAQQHVLGEGAEALRERAQKILGAGDGQLTHLFLLVRQPATRGRKS